MISFPDHHRATAVSIPLGDWCQSWFPQISPLVYFVFWACSFHQGATYSTVIYVIISPIIYVHCLQYVDRCCCWQLISKVNYVYIYIIPQIKISKRPPEAQGCFSVLCRRAYSGVGSLWYQCQSLDPRNRLRWLKGRSRSHPTAWLNKPCFLCLDHQGYPVGFEPSMLILLMWHTL